jgi:hypothetical protein
MFVLRSSERRHSMDELAQLRGFRLEDAEPSDARDYARSRLRAALAGHRRRKRGLVALAFVGAAIVAGTAYGVVRELVIGDPAPEEVKQALARFGHEAELIPYPRPEDPRVEDARVASVLESSVGTAYLFSVPNARDLCGWMWIEGRRGYQGRPDMSSVCGTPQETFVAIQTIDRQLVRFVFGRASDEVARVAVRLGERAVDIPLNGRWFFAELSGAPTAFITYDAAGRVVDQHVINLDPPRGTPTPQPHPVGEMHKVAEISAHDDEAIVLEVAPASDGGYCMTVRSDRRRPNSGCSITKPGPREIGVAAMNFGGAPGGVLLLVGPVGSGIATLELRYGNGRVARVPLSDGWALFEVDRADYAQGRRPEILVGSDASGQQIAAERLPWANAGG